MVNRIAERQRRFLQAGDWLVVASIAAFPILVFLWRRTLDIIFFSLTADDFGRTLHAWQVTQGQLLPSDLWPPLQFWIEALALKVYPYILSVPYLTNLIASTGMLVFLVLLGRELGLGRAGMILSVVLAATTPWLVWLSISGLAEPLFILFIVMAYFGVARWRGRDSETGLWIAALGLLAAGMIRFDGWGYSLVFSVAVVWLWWREQNPRRWLAAAALPWLFPLFWLGFQYFKFGNPFYFSEVTQEFWLDMHGSLDLGTRLAWQPKDLWAVAGVTIPLAAVGLWLLRRQRGLGLLSLMWLTSFALLIFSTLNHTITQANPTRLVLVHALLLAPAAAFALQKLGEQKWLGAAVTAVFVVALVVSRLLLLPDYPSDRQPDVLEVGSHVNNLRFAGMIQPDDRIMIEVIFWDYFTLHVLSGDPGAVVFDREPQAVIVDSKYVMDDVTNPSVLALSGDELRAELERQNVRVVIAHSERAVDHLIPFAQETLSVGRFHVFLLE